MVVMDAVDLERVGDDVGDTIKTLATHHTPETAGMVALTTRSQDLDGEKGGRREGGEREGGREGGEGEGGGRGEGRGREGGREQVKYSIIQCNDIFHNDIINEGLTIQAHALCMQ